MPTVKFTKEEIVRKACEIVQLCGMESLNARRVAFELGGSVQLIYHNFATMDELVAAVKEEIFRIYVDAMNSIEDEEHPYLAKGLSYVRFARDYPEFFKILFMSDTEVTIDKFFQDDAVTVGTIATIGKVFAMDAAQYVEFHKKVWIFTHGIACLLATKTLRMSDEEIKDLIVSTTWDIYKGFMEETHGGCD